MEDMLINRQWDTFVHDHDIQNPDAYLDACRVPYECLQSVQTSFSNVCNYDCRFCDAHFNTNTQNQLFYPELEKIVSFIKRNKPVKNLTFAYSGDPFARNDFFELLERLTSYVQSYTFSTNAGLLTSDAIEHLSRYTINNIQVSIEAAHAQTYERIQKKGDFKKVLKTIEKLTDTFGHRVSFASIVMRENQDSLLDLPEICGRLGVKSIGLLTLNENFKTRENGLNALSEAALKVFLPVFFKRCREHGVSLSLDSKNYSRGIKQYLNKATQGEFAFDESEYTSFCGMPFDQLTIDLSNRLFTNCCYLRTRIPDIWDLDFNRAYNCDSVLMMRAMNVFGKFPSMCKNLCNKVDSDNEDTSLSYLKNMMMQFYTQNENLLKHVDSIVGEKQNLVLWPAGTLTRDLIKDDYFKKHRIVAVLDKDTRGRIQDHEIRRSHHLSEYSYDAVVITSGSFWREIVSDYYQFAGDSHGTRKRLYLIDQERDLKLINL